MKYHVIDYRADGQTHYLSAPVGFYRKSDGTIARDGSLSPEWTNNPKHRFLFEEKSEAERNAREVRTSKVQGWCDGS